MAETGLNWSACLHVLSVGITGGVKSVTNTGLPVFVPSVFSFITEKLACNTKKPFY